MKQINLKQEIQKPGEIIPIRNCEALMKNYTHIYSGTYHKKHDDDKTWMPATLRHPRSADDNDLQTISLKMMKTLTPGMKLATR